jgi:chromosome segregation protein
LSEYEQLVERQKFVSEEIADLEKTKENLVKLIGDISEKIEIKFREGVEKINREFSSFFSTLFSGGKAEIFLVNVPIKKTDEDDIQEYELGIDMKVSLPNKKISGLSMLSGGERSLTSIALLFAMSSITPPPFIILDETDAALDEANSKRYGDMIEKLAEHSQLILITHNRETMSRAGLLYGVTMDQSGVSKLLSVSFEEGQQYAK